jgi:hypothetical protein
MHGTKVKILMQCLSKPRGIRLGWHVARMDESIYVNRILIGKPECKRLLRNLRVDWSVILTFRNRASYI